MNPQLNLRYTHSDRSRVFRDMRSKPEPEIAPEQCYFMGFRISIANDYRYHHALILADNHDSFIQGVKAECQAIHDQSPLIYAHDIALVFVRNLLMRDPTMIDTVENSDIRDYTQRVLAKRDDNQFTVLGTIEDRIRLVSVTTSDALKAIQRVRGEGNNLVENNLKPLEVCQAHPVTKEFDALFQSTLNRIRTLIGSAPTVGGQVH